MVKLVNPKITLQGNLLLDEKAMAMLLFLSEFGISKMIYEKVTTKYTLEDWAELWTEIHDSLKKVVVAYEKMLKESKIA